MKKMEEPAKTALDVFYREEYDKKAKQADLEKEKVARAPGRGRCRHLRHRAQEDRTQTGPSRQAKLCKVKRSTCPCSSLRRGMIDVVRRSTVQIDQSLVSLAPLETLTIFFMVCLVTGLVLASPWVFYQIWAFVAAGLYRHERKYVKKYLPFSLGLFLGGVFLCFLFVLPITLTFLLQFNVWLGVAPTLRLSEWMSFATILPLIFGLSFQTPLVMLFLERINIFTIDDFRAKRKMAILVITIAAAVLTPGQDPFSMLLLAIPMILLYELGIMMIGRSQPNATYAR